MSLHIPEQIVLISGKRKSGKDFLAERLRLRFSEYIPGNAAILRISAPLKKEFACLHGLCFDQLSSSGPYKEAHRREMVCWSDEIRQKDPFYFCHQAASEAMRSSNARIWIVSDIRRPADIRYFDEEFGQKLAVSIFKLRVEASQETRAKRGWKFESGIDDAETECALDGAGVAWDFVFTNNAQSDLEDSFLLSIQALFDRTFYK